MMKSNIHFRVLLQKVTPELPKFLDITRKELEYGWAIDMPQPEGSYDLPGVMLGVQDASKR
jgi:hypothetical protein